MCRGICSPNQRQIEEPNGVFCKSISYLTSIAKTLFFHFKVSEADFFLLPGPCKQKQIYKLPNRPCYCTRGA